MARKNWHTAYNQAQTSSAHIATVPISVAELHAAGFDWKVYSIIISREACLRHWEQQFAEGAASCQIRSAAAPGLRAD